MNIDQEIQNAIRKAGDGELIFSEDFRYTHKPDAVNTALSRAAKLKKIRRIANGIYVKPKKGTIVPYIMPTAEEVARAIAKRDRIRILPSGPYALYQLGLSTQIPANIVFLTDGFRKKYKVGKNSIQFKPTTPKLLSVKGEYSSLVIMALKEIGKQNVDAETKKKMIDILKQEDPRILEFDIAASPVWIGEIMAKALD